MAKVTGNKKPTACAKSISKLNFKMLNYKIIIIIGYNWIITIGITFVNKTTNSRM